MEERKKAESMSMEGLVEHACHFSANVFAGRRDKFEALVAGQHPEILMITCSDSRILPELLTQADAGDLFVLRNAGNIVPAHGAGCGGEQATIEYALAALGVRHVIVCGHSHCGAMKGLLHPELVQGMPRVAGWLAHAEAAHSILSERQQDLGEDERLLQAAKENVVVQMANLETYPAVRARRARGELQIHGWVYLIETGEVLSYEPQSGEFGPLFSPSRPAATRARSADR
ncbi:MAG: carbonic anhydrase [Rhodospirillales bacterium]|nr:carbonic anhydrase [Rhodospirillales bacterium]